MMATFVYFPYRVLSRSHILPCEQHDNPMERIRVGERKQRQAISSLVCRCISIVDHCVSLVIDPFAGRWQQTERPHPSINRRLGQRWEMRREHGDNVLVVELVFGIPSSHADKPVKQKAERIDWRWASGPSQSINQHRIDWWSPLHFHLGSLVLADESIINLNGFTVLI